MNGKIERTSEELSELLDEQIDHLKTSCLAFDNGKVSEAVRIAATIRILLHETRNSHSLLGQLGLRDQPFWDSAAALNDSNLTTHSGLLMVGMGEGGVRQLPWLDGPHMKMSPFDAWWDKVVFRDSNKNSLSRKKLVLTAANQDGGAHIDPKIDATYQGIKAGETISRKAAMDGREITTNSPVPASIRQIGHEVLKTLLGDYGYKNNKTAGTFVGGLTISRTPPQQKFRKDDP